MSKYPLFRTGIGQDSHRFLSSDSSKPCIIGGVIFEESLGFLADSDGDVILHSLCNAITSLTHVPILGGIARDLCLKDGITDSQVYLAEALKTLKNQKIVHVAICLEAQKPKLQHRIDEIRENLASLLDISISAVGITVTSGDGLTDFGCGDGVQCFSIVTTCEEFLPQ